MTGVAAPSASRDREFIVEHTLRAPAARVFAAYTDPVQLPRWWAPPGGALDVEQMDVRAGGSYRFVQRESSGMRSVFLGRYLEVSPVRRLVYTFAVEGQGNEVTTTVELRESPEGTMLRLTNLCASKEIRDAMLKFGAAGGARAAMKRLDGFLADAAGPPGA